MPEWTVVTALITLVGLFTAVGVPIISLINSITKLRMSLDRLDEKFTETTTRNSKAHDALFNTQRDHDRRLDEHDRRITTLEVKD